MDYHHLKADTEKINNEQLLRIIIKSLNEKSHIDLPFSGAHQIIIQFFVQVVQ